MITAINNNNFLPLTDGMQAAAALDSDGFWPLMQSIISPEQQNESGSTAEFTVAQAELLNTTESELGAQTEEEKKNAISDIVQSPLMTANPQPQYNNANIQALAASLNTVAAAAIMSDTTGASNSTDCIEALDQGTISIVETHTPVVLGQAVSDTVSETDLTYQLPSSSAADLSVYTVLDAEVSNQEIQLADAGEKTKTSNNQFLTEISNVSRESVKVVASDFDANIVYCQLKQLNSGYEVSAAISDLSVGAEQKTAAASENTVNTLSDAAAMLSVQQPEVTKHTGAQTDTNSSLLGGDSQPEATVTATNSADEDTATDAGEKQVDFTKLVTDFNLMKVDASVEQVSDTSVPVTDAAPAFAQITDKIAENLKEDGTGTFKLSLYPEGLGEVQVTLECHDSQIKLVITTDNPLTQKLLESQSEQLKAALVTKNYEVRVLNISVKEETSANANDTYAFFERNANDGQSRQSQDRAAYRYYDEDIVNDQDTTQVAYIYNGQLSIWA